MKNKKTKRNKKIKICSFFVLFAFFDIAIEIVANKKVSHDLMIFCSLLIKILYLKSYKWLLTQNHQIRNDFFGYRWH